MFSRAQTLWKAHRNWNKNKKPKTRSFHGQIHLGNIRLNKYKQLSLSHPRRDTVGFFSKCICVLEMYLITVVSFHSFEKHALTRLSLIFKILEQPQSKLIFLKSHADNCKQALLTYPFTGSQRLLCYLQFLTSCFWMLKQKRNASYFFLLLSFLLILQKIRDRLYNLGLPLSILLEIFKSTP